MTSTHNVLALIRGLPADFREVHGPVPRLRTHEDVRSWLNEMADATLVAAENMLAIAETTRKERDIALNRQYLEAHNAIAALRKK